ncbi:Francisella virulence factor A [Fangia hongkongensis]|uniref:Francisella virulence factor A n=1 Tax=Fangia hongkongensis TaxID=270495 RepID=UPI000377A27B|nr:hypothetical protein [Fangia hongkongensis]MBK2125664.1 hypothetical protein [Fangia hongkongensis]
MSRLQQNIIYACLLVAIIGFFWAVYPKHNYTPHGVYLPQTKEKLAPVKLNQVNFYVSQDMDLRKAVPIVNGINESPIGIIRVVTHFKDSSEIQSICEKSVLVAREKAAENGATKVIGNCMSSRQKGPLDGVSLYAYAYK